jgi:hypothetical protein
MEFGYVEGVTADAILQTLARRLSANFRSPTLPAKYKTIAELFGGIADTVWIRPSAALVGFG